MKILKLIILVLLINLTFGCNPDLESINYDEINPAIFPASEADVEALVVAAYYPLRGSWWDGIHTTSENGIMFINDSSTEILQGLFGVQQLATLHSYSPINAEVTRYYDRFYNRISSNTLSIDRLEKSSVNDIISPACPG
jgi:hypothetical protein